MNEKTDVVIAGAGPAGNEYAVRYLAGRLA